jgi:hypothetical protein
VGYYDGELVVIDLTTATLPRRPCAEPLCNVSSTPTSTFAAAGFGVGTRPSKIFAIAAATAATVGRSCATGRVCSSAATSEYVFRVAA